MKTLITDLKLEANTGKCREYTGSNRHRHRQVLRRTQAAQQLRERIDKWDYVKL
jgi:hypothetical protein